MGKNIRVRINYKGANAVRNDPAVQQELLSIAGKIQDAANSGLTGASSDAMYQAEVEPGRKRARAAVWTGGYASIRDNARNNTLLRSLDRGRS
ncbi:hypothetical protein [Mycetocola reblochoni]|uniref:hypothetical protein n=1 Tax=Mycetocola reblochoni TaxID=331618 RepID=UPI00117FC309|nr:hypothetical protein [Mycetocola reblochoni]